MELEGVFPHRVKREVRGQASALALPGDQMCYLAPGVAGQLPGTSRMLVTSNSARSTLSRPIALSVGLAVGAAAALLSPASASIRPVTSTRFPTAAFSCSSAISSSLYMPCDPAPV